MEVKKKSGVAILISDKTEFKTKTVTRDKVEHYIMIKRSIQQENIIIVNIYVSKMGAANYISLLLTKIKRHIDNNMLIVGNLNSPLSAIDRSSKQKINKETRVLNDTLTR